MRKLLEDLTPNRPFGYETSFSVELRDHTGMKSEALLEAKASAAIADAAAFIYIDAIDPIGTHNPHVHERMGRVFDRLMPYYGELGGERVADVAVYYSLESKFNFTGSGRPVSSPDTSDAHTASSMQAARQLIGAHLPFCVVTRQSLDKLQGVKLLVLSNVNMLDEQEVHAIREWVKGGGTLLATLGTSLVDTKGKLQPDFMLADVFGCSIVKADWHDWEHYVAPTQQGQKLFGDWSPAHPPFVSGAGMQVGAHSGAQVLATTTLPWPAPDRSRFSSIHSNPPWEPTERPEIILHEFGDGRVVYCASAIENVAGMSDVFLGLVRMLAGNFRFEADAPAAVEMTVFRQSDRHRYLVSLVNFQKDLPNIPVEDIVVRMRLGDKGPRHVRRIPEGDRVPFDRSKGEVRFRVPRLETLAVFEVAAG